MTAVQNSEDVSHLLDAVRNSDRPVKPSELKKRGLSEKAVKSLLDQLVDDGQLHPWRKRSTAYWYRPAEEFAAQMSLELAGERAMSRPELEKTIANRCFKLFPKAKCEAVVKKLLQSGDLKDLKDPDNTKKKIVFAKKRPVAYLEALAAHVNPFLDAIEKLGARREEFIEILHRRPQQDSTKDAERVFEALQQTQPERGVHVPVRELREHPLVKDLSKEEFDAAVLQLAQQQRIDAAAHAHAAILSPEARDELVFREPDKYYVAIATRI
jgi:hypothetical protein